MTDHVNPPIGLMQSQPLLISSLLQFADRFHGDTEIVSRRTEGDLHRTNWNRVAQRANRIAGALDEFGANQGSKVATLAWNGYRHLELYYGVSGSGRVLHTINPRLHPDQIAWIVNHAEDQILCFDLTFLPLVRAVHARCPTVRTWVALCEDAQIPADTGIANLVGYEGWIRDRPADYEWPLLDENTASSLCYTSGTTGDPKGVLYSHRSTVLHAYAASLPDVMSLSAQDCVLPVVPMFHVNAWGLPYSAALTGCKLVFPGPAMDGKSIHDIVESERVTFAAGVPTIWQGLLGHVQAQGGRFSTLRRTVIGGAACPPSMIQAFSDIGVEVRHAWGMTEMSPLGTACALKNKHLDLSEREQLSLRLKQGRPVFGIDLKIVDEEGCELPWDGRSSGNLLVKGPWVVDDYFASGKPQPLINGWFPTGDVATIDSDGYMHITDRSKDVIKSGGEWISSIEIENVAMAHPSVAMAACIGIRHPKWDERPIVVAVLKPGRDVSRDELLKFYDGKIAKWQIPDDIVFRESIPIGATGKMLKAQLRESLTAYVLPTAT